MGGAHSRVGLSFQVAARMASVIKALTAAASGITSTSAEVAAQPIEEKASAKVASRDEVWRRRNWLRRACTRNQSWIAVAEAAATTIAAGGDRGLHRRGEAPARQPAGQKMTPIAISTTSILARMTLEGDKRRGRDQVGGVLARDRQPGEAAGELARRHHDHGRDQRRSRWSCRQSCATAAAPAAPDRAAASGSATSARDRATAA